MLKSVLSGLFLFCIVCLHAQQATSGEPAKRTYNHRDSVNLSKMNTNGNLMIAGGVGLCGAGSYLIWQGTKILNTTPVAAPGTALYEDEKQRNQRQGIIYLAAGGVGIAGGIILTAFGAKNKVEFKQRKRMMEMQTGLLDNGKLGLALTF
ncbi:MAG: hypothetical protein IPH78_04955 [Bacteroidetes bacterium]|nr:hypothetical protein [Bacteroidota bacterium]